MTREERRGRVVFFVLLAAFVVLEAVSFAVGSRSVVRVTVTAVLLYLVWSGAWWAYLLSTVAMVAGTGALLVVAAFVNRPALWGVAALQVLPTALLLGSSTLRAFVRRSRDPREPAAG